MPQSPTESWTSYILSTYSSSVSPTRDPNQYAPSATPVSAPSASPSPWGPYSKSGRGGAGNFTWQSSFEGSSPKRPHADPEPGHQSGLTQRQRAAAEVEAREQADALAAQPRSEYTHLGRGGAGNYTRSGQIQIAAPEAPPPPPPLPLPPLSTVDPFLAAKSGYYGRGGAGNYTSDPDLELEETAAKRKREEEEQQQQQQLLRKQVEERVEAEMRRPEGAVTREGRGREF